ncbi:hypothetical protein [Geobacter sp. DSM 9736]|uniref:hypothetical protein n=1 Tax=Geobacter sp. DSM 9736 TaxID=1277350 RepID=UPI000B61B69E|nr:hypothetical protein [Geobacter sp. DSM 9736]SNB44938.1 hypothetical protein SAMN06269301_0328 [Geobacter sp. DSM 9736]
MKFEEKFIAFVDVLGFKSMVEASEAGTGMTLPEIVECLSKLGTREDEDKILRRGATICPGSMCIEKNLNFRITQISDCVIVSSEVSPAGLINLVSHCWGAVIELLVRGIMCRGYITRGAIYHQDGQVIGSGYQRAYAREAGVCAFKLEADERGTPFVEIDEEVCRFVDEETDSCVKEMFSRMVKTEDGTTALFPFKRLSHSFIIAGFGRTFDAEKEKEANNNVRKQLLALKERVMYYVDHTNTRAVAKAKHYLRALDEQLTVCDMTDDMISKLCAPLPLRRL